MSNNNINNENLNEVILNQKEKIKNITFNIVKSYLYNKNNNYKVDENRNINFFDIKEKIIHNIFDREEIIKQIDINLDNVDNNNKLYKLIDDIIYETTKEIYEEYLYNTIDLKYSKLKNITKRIQLYLKNNINIDLNDLSKRKNIIETLINYYKETDDKELETLLLEYINVEKEISKQNDQEEKIIVNYKESLKRLTDEKGLSLPNIHDYFCCLREAIYSYDEKNLGKEYTFHSPSIDNSIHRGLSLDFSVPKQELPHLLGITNPNYDEITDKNGFIIELYKKYLEDRKLTNSPNNYLKYVVMYLEKDIIEYLKNNPSETQRIKEVIEKSYDKCIHFINIYEYKKIPEIILDYEPIGPYVVKEEYKDGKYTESRDHKPKDQTHPDDRTKDLITKASQEIKFKNKVKLDDLIKNNHPFNKEEQRFIELIKTQFKNTDNIYVELNSDNNKLNMQYIEKENIVYSFKKNKFWSELEPNIYIVSYDKEEYNKQKKILDKYMHKAILILCIALKKDLNINNQNNKKEISLKNLNIVDEKRLHLINLDRIKEITFSIDDKDFEDLITKYHDIIDIIYSEDNIKDYEKLKAYISEEKKETLSSKINRFFGIANKEVQKNQKNYSLLEEQPQIKMLHRIIRDLIVKDNKTQYIEKSVRIVGYGTIREKVDIMIEDYLREEEQKNIPSKYLNKVYKTAGKFKEKFAKTLMGKTFLQLIYDLRINGRSYILEGISTKKNNKNCYYNCDLLIDDSYMRQLIFDFEETHEKRNSQAKKNNK